MDQLRRCDGGISTIYGSSKRTKGNVEGGEIVRNVLFRKVMMVKVCQKSEISRRGK